MQALLNWVARSRARLGDWLAERLKGNFYLYLAAVLSVMAVLDATVLHIALDMKQKAFDVMVKNRVRKPVPDRDIVIVDIDEKSLATLAQEYGRWPWPRQVLAEFAEQISKQQPKAIVFDMLLSDPDLYNPDSDAYFNEVASRLPNLYFPLLRLDPSADQQSQIRVSQIPGAVKTGDGDKTLALVLPRFDGALRNAKLGTHNLYADDDGIARRYRLFHQEAGWRLPSLPYQLSTVLGAARPVQADGLLNWRGPAFSYRYISFSDVYLDQLNKQRQRPQDEFTGKIVIIGSTAPSLFDIKPTPMAKQFPGVEILATAIDNVRHDDFLHEPGSRWPYLLLALLIIWATAWAFYREAALGRLDKFFSTSQFVLIGISYASLNLSNYYLNLTGPVMFGVAYFSLARFYAFATTRALQTRRLLGSRQHAGGWRIQLALLRLADSRGDVTEAALKNVQKQLHKMLPQAEVQLLEGKQQGLWNFVQGVVAVSWRYPAADQPLATSIAAELAQLQAHAASWCAGAAVNGEALAGLAAQQASQPADADLAARQAWQQLFAAALQQLDTVTSVETHRA